MSKIKNDNKKIKIPKNTDEKKEAGKLLKAQNKAYKKDAENEKIKLSIIAKQQSPKAEWLNLDNSAIIYPASENADMANVYRVSAVLYEEIDPYILQQAVNFIVPRFPSFTSSLKKGIFWYYLEPSNKPLVIERQSDFPCQIIHSDARNALTRIVFFGNEIAVEIFHVAADGTAAITFLNSLIACYLELKGKGIKYGKNCLNYRDKPRPEELIDSYQQMYDGKKLKRRKDIKAYKLKGKRLPTGTLVVIKGILQADKLNETAKNMGATVGQLLNACLIDAMWKDRTFFMRSAKKPVIIAVPINLRKKFGGKTLRNFIGLMHIKSYKHTEFDALLQEVKQQMIEQSCEEELQSFVNYNVRMQRNKFFKFIPLPIKTLGLKLALKIFSDDVVTTCFSNLGIIEAPDEFKNYVLRYDFFFGPQKTQLTGLFAATYNNQTVLSFSRTSEESYIEKYFFRKLSDLGLKVAIETNYEL